MRPAWGVPGLLAAAILVGCAAPIPRGALPLDTSAWGLKQSISSRSEVLAKLGEPAASYENGSIAAYRFVERRAGDTEVERTVFYWPVTGSSSGPFLNWSEPAAKPGEDPNPIAYTLLIRYGADDRIAAMHGCRTFYIPWAWSQSGR